MIELTTEQARAIDDSPGPLQMVNPQTREVYVVIRKEVYDIACSIVGGGQGQVWDDAADDDLMRKGS